jgi:hypothetical protein
MALKVRDVEQKLRLALDTNGYTEVSYFAVPGGFAMVTRLEQYEEDGTSKVPPDRWSVDVLPLRTFSLSDYIRALFQANPGYYRIIIFVVTPVPFVESSATVSRDEAMEWLRTGLNKLPASLGESPYTTQHTCTALVYEYMQATRGQEVKQTRPGHLSATDHLMKAKLLALLK